MGTTRRALTYLVKNSGRTAEEIARIARRRRLEQVKAALAPPEPPPAPEPPPLLLRTADILRNVIGQQSAAVTPLNGQQILDEAAQKLSAPGSRQDRTADQLKRLLGPQPPTP
ncbi:MAG: hypothetical protein WCJ42_12015 [Actinomycetes bacterium]